MPTKQTAIYPTYMAEYLAYSAIERNTCNNRKPPTRINTKLMSRESRKELMNAVNWLKLFSPLQKTYCHIMQKKVTFRLNFITLTLSSEQRHDDKFIKSHMLEPFLKWMARKGANTYVWKAETQNNGNIHFHITGNRYIYYKAIALKWNNLQAKHGYIEPFFTKFGHDSPNSTDVHAVKDDSEIGIYICKEFGKTDAWSTIKGKRTHPTLLKHPSRYIEESLKNSNEMPLPKRQIEGRKWAVSNNLTGLRCFINENEPNYFAETTNFLKEQNFKHIAMDFAKLWFYPHIIDGKCPEYIAKKLKQLKEAVNDYD